MTINPNKYFFGLASAAMLFIISCGGNITYTENYSMKNKIWRLTDVKSFDVQITDTTTLNDIFFTIRTGSDYPFRNIFLFVSTLAPDGNNLADTLEYYLADDKGAWYGKGFGDVRELKLPYKSNIYFPKKGEYKFNVQHGMRIEDLKGVYDIGLRIEKTKKQVL
jgi:gliding motility-associated lipoprotein GldH